MKRARLFHAGCGVCERAAHVAAALDPRRYSVEEVHLGEEPALLAEARALGVRSVPALEIEGQVLHLDFGASLDDLVCWWDWRRAESGKATDPAHGEVEGVEDQDGAARLVDRDPVGPAQER